MKTNNVIIISVLSICISASSGCKEEDPFIIPAADGVVMDVETGGPTQPNQVFINLAFAQQSGISRGSWDLGFATGSEFRVVINTTNGALVRKLERNDLTSVSAQDTTGFGAMQTMDAIFNAVINPPAPDWVAETVNWIDDPAGDLTKTAIDLISATDAGNNVYILNRGKNPDGSQRGWLKFRILQSANGYELRYAQIASSTFETISITKDEAYNFNYFDFDSGETIVEPEKDAWDISFTTYFEILNFGDDFPYAVNDYVLLNRNSVSVSEVILDTDQDLVTEYESFTLSDAQTLAYHPAINAIGSNWRTVASPTPGSITGVKSDRFYVIKNGEGNYFKLIFTRMLNDQGERGYPQIQYKLLQ